LIYTDAFDAIPGAARQYLLRRLFEVLSGHDQSPDSAALTAEERRNILEILLDTKPGFQEEWKRFSQEPQNQKGSN
jgi:endo-1,4-beta-D-glucanase Y